MTAQIGIFNKKGIALATDSAVTINMGGKEKVLNTAEKLFELIPGAPVGIMIYNNAEFMSIPFEILIKEYRKLNLKAKFNSLEECKNSFIEYLRENRYVNNSCEEYAFLQLAYSHFQTIIDVTLVEIEKLQILKTLERNEMDEILFQKTKDYEEYLNEMGLKEGFEEFHRTNEFGKYDDKLCEIVRNAASNPKEEDVKYIVNVLKLGVCSNALTSFHTGIVIAGFGENDLYARQYNIIVELSYNGVIKSTLVDETIISNEESATVRAFAQTDMVEAFINGINPDARGHIRNMLLEYLYNLPEHYVSIKEQYCEYNNIGIDKKGLELEQHDRDILEALGSVLFDAIEKDIGEMQHLISSPFMSAVDTLDKQELAELAESLVNITSLKRKMSIDIETVGGPIDVAIITKGEGFVWIKRKYYFDKELNPFYNDKKRRDCYGD